MKRKCKTELTILFIFLLGLFLFKIIKDPFLLMLIGGIMTVIIRFDYMEEEVKKS